MSTFNPTWLVIYTRPHMEKKIALELAKLEIDYFLPLKRETRQWHDRNKIVEVPLFQSYVFIRPSNLQSFYTIQTLKGFCYYLKSENKPVKVPEKLIEQIRLVINSQLNVSQSSDRFEPHQTLLIQKGVLTGLFCEIVSDKGKSKVLVRVKLLNRILLIDIPKDYLSSLSVIYEKVF